MWEYTVGEWVKGVWREQRWARAFWSEMEAADYGRYLKGLGWASVCWVRVG